MMPADEEVDVEVERVDMTRICEFGRLSRRKHEIEDELKALRAVKDESSMLDEAILLAPEEPGALKLLLGQMFVDVGSDAANDFVTKEQARTASALDRLEGELGALLARQHELKGLLYAKFGKSINLEE